MTIQWVTGYVNPQGTTDYKVLKASGADGSSAIHIGSLPYPPGTPMTFSVWWKAVSASTASLEV